MTPHPVAACLDRVTVTAMLEALPRPPGTSVEDTADLWRVALGTVAALRPRDPLEVALAVRVVLAHHGVMESFRCAAGRDLPATLQLRHQAKAIALSRLMDATLRDLQGRQQQPALLPVTLPADMPLPRDVNPAVAAAKVAPPQPPSPVQPPPPRQVTPAPGGAARSAVGLPQQAVASAPTANGGALTAGQREQMMRDIAARAATAATNVAA